MNIKGGGGSEHLNNKTNSFWSPEMCKTRQPIFHSVGGGGGGGVM